MVNELIESRPLRPPLTGAYTRGRGFCRGSGAAAAPPRLKREKSWLKKARLIP